MWGSDLTTTLTAGEGQAAIFFAVDHYSLECVGLHGRPTGHALRGPGTPQTRAQGAFRRLRTPGRPGLARRHDHGSQYVSHDVQDELAFLGIESSPALVRTPEGNGIAERFVRLLKENLLWVRTFSTVEELRQALLEFQRTYNHHWISQRHGYKTPAQVRLEQSRALSRAA